GVLDSTSGAASSHGARSADRVAPALVYAALAAVAAVSKPAPERWTASAARAAARERVAFPPKVDIAHLNHCSSRSTSSTAMVFISCRRCQAPPTDLSLQAFELVIDLGTARQALQLVLHVVAA